MGPPSFIGERPSQSSEEERWCTQTPCWPVLSQIPAEGVRRLSCVEQVADLSVAYRFFGERERTALAQLPARAQKGSKSNSGERAADADALHTDLRKRCKTQL